MRLNTQDWIYIYIWVSKNRGTPKWMVYNGKPYQNGRFGGTTIFGNIHIYLLCLVAVVLILKVVLETLFGLPTRSRDILNKKGTTWKSQVPPWAPPSDWSSMAKTNSSPLKSYLRNRKGWSSNQRFSGVLFNFWKENILLKQPNEFGGPTVY